MKKNKLLTALAVLGLVIFSAAAWSIGYRMGKENAAFENTGTWDEAYEAGRNATENEEAVMDSATKATTSKNSTASTKKAVATILSHSSSLDYGYYSVVGEVQNDTGATLSNVRVTATFYDANKKVIATGDTYVQPGTLAPGEKASFKITNIGEAVNQQIASYELKAI